MEDYIPAREGRERVPWIVTTVILLFGLGLYIVWSWLWVGAVLLIILGIGGTAYVLGKWCLSLRGQYLEQNKTHRLIYPVEGKLPAVIKSDGDVVVLDTPHFRPTYRDMGDSVRVEEVTPLALLEPLRPVAPRLERAQGDFRPGHLVMGYGPSGPVRLGLEDAGSIGVVGKSGTGKTTTIRYLAWQFGGDLHVWDGHASIGLPGTRFEPEDMLEDGEELRQIYEDRKQLFSTGVRRFGSILLVVDEWKELYRPLKKVQGLLSNLITGGRKFGMHLIISSQYFKAEMFEGGAGDLDSIWTRYLHWTDSRQAEYARASEDETGTMLNLIKKWGPAGYAVLSNPKVESSVLSVPNVGEEVFKR